VPFRLVEPSELTPVTVDEAKKQLRLETPDDDDQVERLIGAATKYIEERCWRGLMQQQWELVLPGFCGPSALELPGWVRGQFKMNEALKLPRGHLATLDEEDGPAVESVKYIDPNGVERTLDVGDYSVDNVSLPPVLRPAYGKSWPSTRDQWDAVRILYTVGWGIDEVPEDVKQAVLLAVSEMYEKRTPEIGEMPAVMALIGPYRLNEVG